MTGSRSTIVPFWEMIPQILKYPAKSESMLTIGFFTFLWLFALTLGLIGLLVRTMLLAGTYRFCYSVLVHSANGHMDPPDNYFRNVSNRIFLQQLGMYLLLFLMIVAATALHWFAGLLAAAIVVLGLPIATMSLAIDQSVWRAVSPLVWFEGMRRIGMPYGLVVLFLVLLLVSSWTIRAFLVPALPFLMGYIVLNFVSMYFLVAMFFLMGYVIYQYHDEFGWEPEAMREDFVLPVRMKQRDPILVRVEDLIEEGKSNEAMEVLAARVDHAGPMSEQARIFVTLCESRKDHSSLTAYGKRALPKLLGLSNGPAALALIEKCIEADPGFHLDDGHQMYQLAEFADRQSRSQQALKLTNDFARRYPGHYDIPLVYWLSARILSDKMGRDAESLKILRQLEKRFPDHEIAPEVTQYRQKLEAVLGPQHP